jgi:hypothetical protein
MNPVVVNGECVNVNVSDECPAARRRARGRGGHLL